MFIQFQIIPCRYGGCSFLPVAVARRLSRYTATTAFEHQVQGMYASRKVQIFSSLRRRETEYLHQKGHQRSCEITGFNNDIESTNNTEYKKYTKTIKTEKNAKTYYLVFRNNQKVFSSLHAGELDWKTKNIGFKVTLSCWDSSFRPSLLNFLIQDIMHYILAQSIKIVSYVNLF